MVQVTDPFTIPM